MQIHFAIMTKDAQKKFVESIILQKVATAKQQKCKKYGSGEDSR